MSISKLLVTVFSLILFTGAAVAQDPVPLYPQSQLRLKSLESPLQIYE